VCAFVCARACKCVCMRVCVCVHAHANCCLAEQAFTDASAVSYSQEQMHKRWPDTLLGMMLANDLKYI